MRGDRVWVVGAGDGATLGEILRKVGEGAGAIADGRVFIGKKRALAVAQPVRPGDAVRIGAAAAARPPIEILFEKEGLVACVKPAGIPTVPDHGGAAHALVAVVAKQLGRRSEDLIVTSRLDRLVSGVVVFALDAEAEARLRAARAEGRYARRYVAIGACGETPPNDEGVWDAPIDDKPSSTRFAVVRRLTEHALFAADPVTGRTHQIRIHASRAGSPLVGDVEYGAPERITLATGTVLAWNRIALHAARVVVPDGQGEPLVALAPIPPELEKLWSALGGSLDDLDRAVSVSTPAA